MNSRLIDKLAIKVWKRENGLIHYLFQQGEKQGDGSIVIPENVVMKWNRRIGRDYISLSGGEKNDPRSEAESLLEALGGVEGLQDLALLGLRGAHQRLQDLRNMSVDVCGWTDGDMCQWFEGVEQVRRVYELARTIRED